MTDSNETYDTNYSLPASMVAIGGSLSLYMEQPEPLAAFGFLGATMLAVDYAGKKGAEHFQNRHELSSQATSLSSAGRELESPTQREDNSDLDYMSLLEEDE